MNAHGAPDGVGYIQMSRETDPYAAPVTSTGRHNRLPSGYANKASRTRLRGRDGRVLMGADRPMRGTGVVAEH